MASRPRPNDPYLDLHREAHEFDFDVLEQMASSLHANLRWNEIQRYASDLGIEVEVRNRSTLCRALAERGVFYGPVGDDRVYIRDDGVTRPLDGYIAEQYSEDDDFPWE